MFDRCLSLNDIKFFDSWDVSNGNNFSHMFWDDLGVDFSDLTPMKYWDVSN